MKKKIYSLLLFLLAFTAYSLIASCVFAMPANPNGFSAQLENGNTIEVFINGDENFSYFTDKDGFVLVRKSDGSFKYKTDSNNHDMQLFDFNGRPFSAIKESQMQRPSENEMFVPSESSAVKMELSQPVTVESHLLTIMIEYNDMKFSSYDDAFWSGKFYSETENSVNKYYMEASGGQQKFTPAAENYGTANDGLIRVSVNKNHPQPELGTYDSQGNRVPPTSLQSDISHISCVYDAVTGADRYIDYSSFDTNHDGYLSNDELCISIIVAGNESSYNGEYAMSVWAHQWMIPNTSSLSWSDMDGIDNFEQYQLLCDNVHILSDHYGPNGYQNETYTMQGELWKRSETVSKPLEIGVLCHELGHVLGLKDLYDTVYSGIVSQETGGYCLMASGSWGGTSYYDAGSLPTHLCAFNKLMLGWYEPIEISANDTSVFTVNSSLSDVGYNVYLVETDDSNEFFLVENRQLSGFDNGLARFSKSGGIAIWHVDMSVVAAYYNSNTINVATHTLGVELEHCGFGRVDMQYGVDPLWHSGSGRYLTFGSFSVPNSRLNSDPSVTTSAVRVDSGVNISVKSESADKMTFSLVKPEYETVATLVNNKLRVQFINYTDDDVLARPLMTSFLSDGRLSANRWYDETTFAANSRSEFSAVDYTKKDNINKLYIWNFNTMKPLVDAYDITK